MIYLETVKKYLKRQDWDKNLKILEEKLMDSTLLIQPQEIYSRKRILGGLRRSEIQKLLINQLDEEDFVCGSEVKTINETESKASVTLENVQTIIEGDFVIGADGIRSAVLKNLFADEYEKKLKFTNCAAYWGFFDYNPETDSEIETWLWSFCTKGLGNKNHVAKIKIKLNK